MTEHELWPDEDERDEDVPDEQWPDSGWPPAADWPQIEPWPIAPEEVGGNHRVRRFVIVGVAALTAGAVATLAVKNLAAGGAPGAGQPAASQSNSAAPGQQGGPQQGLSGELLLGGTVRAVGPTSITIAAGPQSITAAVTGSTRFTGNVTRIGEVRVGDEVVAQIDESNGAASVASLQDPASPS
jgi:hypothetical protein